MSMINTESATWFDRLPNEILFLIFDYLSSNDIIYTFFDFNQRFNNILLQNQCYLTYLELPITDLNRWKNILSIIGSRIEILKINTIDLSFPLTKFPNLKSLIISSHYGFPEEQLKLILEWDQFQNLTVFKHKQNKLFSNDENSSNQKHLLKLLLNQKSPLEVFEYSLPLSSITKLRNSFEMNLNLRSLTLNLYNFDVMLILISYTPNLEYFNLRTQSLSWFYYDKSIVKTNNKLKKFYLTLTQPQFDCDGLIDGIQVFSSSLTCLSLDLIKLSVRSMRRFPFHSSELKQFLESMTELKQFHLYARRFRNQMNNEMILSQFQNHNWSFGMHGDYFYTLPFHFDYLYRFDQGFNGVKSNNPDILQSGPGIWYSVNSIELLMTSKYDLNFLQKLKIEMPKLTFILFDDDDYMLNEREEIRPNKERNFLALNHVTTIRCPQGRLTDEEEWIIHSLPNLKKLILSSTKLPLIDNQLTEILNKQIQQLDINPEYELEQLININYVYFSNVQYIYLTVDITFIRPASYPDIIIKILNNFQNLKILILYSCQAFIYYLKTITTEVTQLIQNLNINNYQIKHFEKYLLFSKNILGK